MMAWTKEPPTETGWYFVRNPNGATPPFGLYVAYLHKGGAAYWNGLVALPRDIGGEWWDVPIPEPPVEKPKTYTCKGCGQQWKEPTPNPHDIAYYGELKSCPDCKDYAPPPD